MRDYCWLGSVAVAAGMVAWGTYRGCAPPGAGPGGAAGPEGEGEPSASARAVFERSAAKWLVVRALLAGEGTLLESATRFRELNAQEPRVLAERNPDV